MVEFQEEAGGEGKILLFYPYTRCHYDRMTAIRLHDGERSWKEPEFEVGWESFCGILSVI